MTAKEMTGRFVAENIWVSWPVLASFYILADRHKKIRWWYKTIRKIQGGGNRVSFFFSFNQHFISTIWMTEQWSEPSEQFSVFQLIVLVFQPTASLFQFSVVIYPPTANFISNFHIFLRIKIWSDELFAGCLNRKLSANNLHIKR